MERCGLQNLGYEGYPFTWLNGRGGNDNIQCMIDYGFATSNFLESFPLTRVVHLPHNGSDHVVLRIMIELEVHNKRRMLCLYLKNFELRMVDVKDGSGTSGEKQTKVSPTNFQILKSLSTLLRT